MSCLQTVAALFCMLAGMAIHSRINAQHVTTPEYQLKSVFLYNFSQFVEWPEETMSESNAPFIIGVVGKDPFGAYLDETVKGERLKGRPMEVRRYGSVQEMEFCHILFVSPQINPSVVIEALSGSSTLTVGESAEFIRAGGMIRFFRQNNTIRFQINPEAAKAANLTISSKLLSLAEISRH